MATISIRDREGVFSKGMNCLLAGCVEKQIGVHKDKHDQIRHMKKMTNARVKGERKEEQGIRR